MNETKPSFSIQAELAKMPPEQARFIGSRLAELSAFMPTIVPYQLRDDSRLAFRFVTDALPWSPYAVVHEMASQQFLCDHAHIAASASPFLKALAKECRMRSGASWTQTWTHVADLGAEIHKIQCMMERGIMIPDFIPDASQQMNGTSSEA